MRKQNTAADLTQPLQKQKIECQYFKKRIPSLISELETNELILSKFVLELSNFNSKVENILIEQPYQMRMPDTKNLFEHIKNSIVGTFEKNKIEVHKLAVMAAELKKSKFDMETYFKDNTRRTDNLLDRKAHLQNQVNIYTQSYSVLEKITLRQSLTQCRYTKNDPTTILNSATTQNQLKILKQKIDRMKNQLKQMEQKQFLLYVQSNQSMANCLQKVRLLISDIIEYQKQEKFVTFNRFFQPSEKKKSKKRLNSISQFQGNDAHDLGKCIDEARMNCEKEATPKIDPTNLKDVLKYAFLAESRVSRDSGNQNYDNSNENTIEDRNNFKKVKN